MEHYEELRQKYIKDLSAIVTYNGVSRSRVRYPKNWERVNSVLAEGVSQSIDVLADPSRKVWVWSDTHFFHKNIIDFSSRPYPDVPTMNEHMVANFNDCVGKNDISIWVGDVGFRGDGFINELLDQCNGYKILVVGNHDFDEGKIRKLKFDEIHLLYTIKTDDVNLVFTHYPMNNIELPWFNLHGHLHAYPVSSTGNPLHHNINCELQSYRPVELSSLVKIAKLRTTAVRM